MVTLLWVPWLLESIKKTSIHISLALAPSVDATAYGYIGTISGATELSTNVPHAVRAGSEGIDCTVDLYVNCLEAFHFTAC